MVYNGVQRCTNDQETQSHKNSPKKCKYLKKMNFRIPIKKMAVQLFLTEFQSVQGVKMSTKFVQTYLYNFFHLI